MPSDPEYDAPRQAVFDMIQSHAGNHNFTNAPQDAMLVSFLLVAEWEGPDGNRYISKLGGDRFRDATPWRDRGLAAEVLHGPGWVNTRASADEDEDDET